MADSPPAPVLKKVPTAEYNPSAGCAIFVIGGVAILALVIWFFYAGWKQSKEIANFTDTEPKKLALAEPAPEKLAALHSKLEAYAKTIEEKKAAELSLTKDDLALMLASEESLASIRQNVAVSEMGERIKASVSLPMNGIGAKRYLNGFIDFKPVILESKGVAFQTENVTVPGKTVSDGFVKLYRDMNFLDDMLLKAFREHPTFGPPLKKTSSIELTAGVLLLKFSPSASPIPSPQ